MIHIHGAPESYEHMQGTPKKAHEGSQSKHPQPAFGGNHENYKAKGGSTPNAKADDDRGNPTGMADADE